MFYGHFSRKNCRKTHFCGNDFFLACCEELEIGVTHMKCRLDDAEQDDVLFGFFRGPGAAHGVPARSAKGCPSGM